MVQSTSERADAALSSMTLAHKRSKEGRKIVVDTVAAMTEIEEFSTSVAKITKMIDEIAFQTNLLALNAGVEAARAGSAGAGFAVVASEVRGLAQRSSTAAGQINALIAESARKVEEGARLVNQTSKALEDIDSSVTHMSEEAEHIADASKDQAARIAEINVAVTELDQLTKENATMSQETQAANMSMIAEAQTLAAAVSGFTVNECADANSDVPLKASA